MRILWVSQDFPPDRGGVQTYSAELVRALVARGHAVQVVAPARPGAAAYDADHPAQVIRVRCPRDAMPVASIPAVVAATRRSGVDAIVAAQWGTAGGAIIARTLGWRGRLAIAAHGRELLWCPAFCARAHDRARRALLGAADRIFAVSEFTAGLARAAGARAAAVRVIANGVSPSRFVDGASERWADELRAASRDPIIVTIARLVPHKGIDTMLRALARVHAHGISVRYVVVGNGPDAGRLRAIAAAVGVADAVVWRTDADDRERCAWLHACDLFALLSRSEGCNVEGFGISLLEAAACGKPCIAGRSGGIPEVVEDGRTGVLCDPLDADAVALQIADLLADPRRLRAFGFAARERLSRGFTWTDAARAVEQALANGHIRVTTESAAVIDSSLASGMVDCGPTGCETVEHTQG